jgi:hypothetical protein
LDRIQVGRAIDEFLCSTRTPQVPSPSTISPLAVQNY